MSLDSDICSKNAKMSNSDLNFKDNSTIYEIFRACRLCGAGGGYKMPIIQDVVGLDCDVELKQKIRECVQLEVSEDDKMPPLICELCVDKVNDFYEFLDMCRQTNNRTRSRLGLPTQAVQGTLDGDCILGITETVYTDEAEESRAKSTSRPRPKSLKQKNELQKSVKEEKSEEKIAKKHNKAKGLKRELQNLMQIENTLSTRESRQRENSKESRQGETSKESLRREFRSSTIVNRAVSKGRVSPPPVRETRQSIAESDNVSLSSLRKHDQKKGEKPVNQPMRTTKDAPTKSILKKEKEKRVEDEDTSALVPLGKRSRSEPLMVDLPSKRVKLTIKLPPPPKVEKGTKKEKDAAGDRNKAKVSSDHSCNICGRSVKTAASLSNHLRFSHIPTFTSALLACNACGLWFEDDEQTGNHHKRYHKTRPYHCLWCNSNFKLHRTYTAHFERNKCTPCPSKADLACTKCSKKFPTANLRSQHWCTGKSAAAAARGKCGRNFTQPTVKKQESSCPARKTNILDEVRMALGVRESLRNLSVRVARCDPLLKQGRCRASEVPFAYGLDQNAEYPYLASRVRVKSEPFIADGMVSIDKDIKDELYTEEDYVHWDSDLSSEDEYDNGTPIKRVEPLSNLALKTMFSRRCIGKVPRKLRKLKTEKFDLYTEFDMSGDISNIIKNLGDTDAVDYDSDSLLERDTGKRVLNSDFDSIFNGGKSQNDVGLNDETDSDDNNKHVISMGSETDASVDEQDANKKQTETKEIEGSNVNGNKPMETNNMEADVLNDKVTSPKENEQDNVERIDTSNVEEEFEKKINEDTNETKQNGTPENNEEISRLNDKKCCDNVNDSDKVNDSADVCKCSDKVNGEAEKDDTAMLIDEIDAQIEGSYRNSYKAVDDNRKSVGMENICDEEFNFDT